MTRFALTLAHLFWTLLNFYLVVGLQPNVTGHQAPSPSQCRWRPWNPETPWEREISLPLFDDEIAQKTGSLAPWSYKPLCYFSKYDFTKKYCAYTSNTFRGNHGVSVITTPDLASNLAKAIDDPYYFWERGVQSHPPALQEAREAELWEIGDVPGKGKGVIAKRDIEAGEVLMLDFPIMIVSMTFPYDLGEKNGYKLLDEAVTRLPDPSLVYDLAASSGGELIEDILKTNNFGLPINNEPHMGLYPKISRINHDCAPYASIRFSHRSLALEVIAYRKIPKGQEISVSYTPLGLPSTKRKNMLSRWGFSCSCRLCSSKERTKFSDERRNRMEDLLNYLDAISKDPQKVHELGNELLHLTMMESLQGKLGEYYEVIALAFARLGEIADAKKYVALARKFWITYDGVDMERLEGVERFTAILDQAGEGIKVGPEKSSKSERKREKSSPGK